jgi:hypothetical protein
MAMRFLSIQRPLLAAAAGISRPSVTSSLVAPIGAQLANALVQGRRNASVKAQGAYKKKSKRGIPNKLGAKRTGGAFLFIHFYDNCRRLRGGRLHGLESLEF